jgi:hypothetical protein
VPATEYRDGTSWAIIDDDPLDARDRWAPPTNDTAELITTALDEMASSSTLRAGRLLAPLGIRFVVVPEFDGVVSTIDDPLPPPEGLLSALESQLDLVGVIPELPTLERFENRAWIPTQALLTGDAAAASTAAGADVLVRSDLSDAEPVFIGSDALSGTSQTLDPGVVTLAVPDDDRWTLSVDGEQLASRSAFGQTTAFDVADGGSATLRYETSVARIVLVLLQALLWAAALLAAGRVRVPVGRRPVLVVDDDTVIDLTMEPDLAAVDPGLVMGPPARPPADDRADGTGDAGAAADPEEVEP